MTTRKSASLEPRIAALETGVQQIREDIHEMTTEVKRMSRPQYQLVVAVLGVLLTFGALVVNRLDKDINIVTDALQRHVELEAHPGALKELGRNEERMLALERSVQQLDIVLQREMRLLDAEGATQREALDKRLQMEMRLLGDISAERMRALERAVFKDQ